MMKVFDYRLTPKPKASSRVVKPDGMSMTIYEGAASAAYVYLFVYDDDRVYVGYGHGSRWLSHDGNRYDGGDYQGQYTAYLLYFFHDDEEAKAYERALIKYFGAMAINRGQNKVYYWWYHHSSGLGDDWNTINYEKVNWAYLQRDVSEPR